MAYFFGIDQGGSKTHALIGDEKGTLLGFGKAQGACHAAQGMEAAMDAIGQAANEALAQAGLRAEQVSAMLSSMTGADWPEEKLMLEAELRRRYPHMTVEVVNDCMGAMRAGTHAAGQAVICAGSGLNCAVKRSDGETYIYGYYIEDAYQGGGALGRAALRAVFDAHAGLSGPTALCHAVKETLGFSDTDSLMKAYLSGAVSHKQVMSLALVLLKTAERGDPTANDILCRFGAKWARYVGCALQRLDMLHVPVEVVLSGSIFKPPHASLYPALEQTLARMAPNAQLVQAEFEPVVGAYLLALDAAGHPCDFSAIRSQARRFSLLR